MLFVLFRGIAQTQVARFSVGLGLTTSRDGYKRIRIGPDACGDIASASHGEAVGISKVAASLASHLLRI
jgi:hypothetical protein